MMPQAVQMDVAMQAAEKILSFLFPSGDCTAQTKEDVAGYVLHAMLWEKERTLKMGDKAYRLLAKVFYRLAATGYQLGEGLDIELAEGIKALDKEYTDAGRMPAMSRTQVTLTFADVIKGMDQGKKYRRSGEFDTDLPFGIRWIHKIRWQQEDRIAAETKNGWVFYKPSDKDILGTDWVEVEL